MPILKCQFRSHWYDSTPEKSRRRRDSNPGSSALEVDALTTRPTRRYPAWAVFYCHNHHSLVVGWLLNSFMTITADIERRIQALEMRCFHKLLGISYTDHITNEEVKVRIGNAIGPYEDLLTSAKRRKLKWYGHVTRSSGLAKTVLQGTVQGGRRRGRQRKRWEDNIKEWTGLEWNIMLRKTENREEWRKLVVKSTVVPQRSARLRD